MRKKNVMKLQRRMRESDYCLIASLTGILFIRACNFFVPIIRIYSCRCLWCYKKELGSRWTIKSLGHLWNWRPLCLTAACATDCPQTYMKCSCPKAAASPPVLVLGCLCKPSKAISLAAGSAHKWTCLNKIRVPLTHADIWGEITVASHVSLL